MAKGVRSIVGNVSPEVGEKNYYEVASLYPGTVLENENQIKWKLYVQQSSGNWRELRGPQKTGKKAPFTFPEKWLGKKLLIEAFAYHPELKSPPGLIVTPKSAKVPKINKVELLYVDDTPGKVFSFMEQLRAKAHCVNMFGKRLLFTLWEDDAKGSRHDPKNKIIEQKEAQVNKSGIATAEFMLTKALMKKAMQGEADVKQLEFYITVEYYKNKKHATENVDVNNPYYNPNPNVPLYPPKKTELKQPPKAKGSPAEQKGNSQKEEKGILDKIEEKWDVLWDWWEAEGTIMKERKPIVQKPEGRTTPVINKQEKKEEKICDCQKYDLIWGGKVSCEFRKKVVEIAERLGKDPDLLMAGMALETGRTFSPKAGKNTSYVGLIQFGDAAAKSVGTTREELLKMSALQQLDYVEKYLEKKKDQINTLTDFYLSILMPVDVGKGNHPNHVVFDNEYPLAYNKNGKLTDLSKSRHYGYRQNPAFYFEGELHKNIKIKKSNGKSQTFKELYNEKKTWYENGEKNYNGPGKTYIWEIEKSISKFYEEGKRNKANLFDCHKSETKDKKFSEDKGTWNVIVTEKYTGSKCTHIERTPIRNNCRRGKIEVYDHKGNIVLRINDCLLEGVAGEDRMAKNADIPFGVYQINKETPFYFSDSTNIISYGPNPRLVFEPISGEAKTSGRSAIRIHGGRQEGYKVKTLKRAQGCIRVWDDDAKRLYDWWLEFKKNNPNVKPGKVTVQR